MDEQRNPVEPMREKSEGVADKYEKGVLDEFQLRPGNSGNNTHKNNFMLCSYRLSTAVVAALGDQIKTRNYLCQKKNLALASSKFELGSAILKM